MTSNELFEMAKKVIPGGVSSPVRSFKHVGIAPIYFQRAEGPYLYDVEGKRYVDFCLGFGPHILGHSDPTIVQGLQRQLALGTTFGACHPKEVEMAHWILKSYPFLQKVRLMNSGTEAVMTALRLARGATNRGKILMFEGCYHGHSDTLLAKAGSGVAELSEASSQGVPASLVSDTLLARYDDFSSIEAAFNAHPDQIAAVIMEPIPANYGLYVPPYDHVKKIFEFAKSKGALVIFDEVITGFRVGLGGASAYYDLMPDLVTLGKVIGGGLPLAAVVGKEAVMNLLAPLGPVYQAGTFAGNILATAAGCLTIEKLFEHRPQWVKFDERCEAFANELNTILKPWGDVQVKTLGSIFWMHFGAETQSFPPAITPDGASTYAKFFKAALDQGVYFAPSPYEVGFVTFAHSPDVLEDVKARLRKCLPSA